MNAFKTLPDLYTHISDHCENIDLHTCSYLNDNDTLTIYIYIKYVYPISIVTFDVHEKSLSSIEIDSLLFKLNPISYIIYKNLNYENI